MSTNDKKEEGGVSLGWLFAYVVFDFLLILGLLGILGKRAQDTAWAYCTVAFFGAIFVLALFGLAELVRLVSGG